MRQRNSPVYSISMENIVGNECCKTNKPIEKIDPRSTRKSTNINLTIYYPSTLIYREIEKITSNVRSSSHILQVSFTKAHFIVKVSFVA